MDRKNILELYKDAKALTGFRENREEKGWMPKLGPNDFRSVIRRGIFEGEEAVIEVSPHKDLARIARDFRKYHKTATKIYPVLQVPPILRSGRIKGAQFIIQESAPSGKRMLENYPLSDDAQKEEVARVYWNTVANFPKFDVGKLSALDYLLERLTKWLVIGKENGAMESGFISQNEKDEAVELIFSDLDRLRNLSCLKMEPFFSHFSNTDVIKADDTYYIWGAEIVPKPEAAGVAYWLWGATLYAYRRSPKWWFHELNKWVTAFVEFAPENLRENLEVKIRINLLERFLGSLLVDLPLKRSPFDKLSETEIEKAKQVIRFAFLRF